MREIRLKTSSFIAVSIGISVAMLPGRSYAQSAPKPNITIGWTYLWADQGAGERSNLNGWFARPALMIGKGYAVFADFTNYYGANHKGAINSHGYTFGVSKNVFATRRLNPRSSPKPATCVRRMRARS
jgi:hypothetical protein